MVNFRAILLWLMMLAVPFQGYAAAAMAFCGPEPAQSSADVVHDHSQHDHGAPGSDHHHAGVSSDDNADHADALGVLDESGASHKCGNCAACHSVGITPTLVTPIFGGLPQADLTEPRPALATVPPDLPHKPPRA